MDYPKELPLAELQDVLKTIREKAFVTNRAQFFNDVWTIQGYTQDHFLGSPGTPANTPGFMASRDQPVTPDEPLPTDEEVAEYLESAVALSKEKDRKMSAINVPWGKIAQWALTLALQMLIGGGPAFAAAKPAEEDEHKKKAVHKTAH